MRRTFFILLAISWMLASCEFFPADPKLTTSVEDFVSFGAEGGEVSIMVSSNCDWEAESIATVGVYFLSVSPQNGRSGDSVLKIRARENLVYGRRSAAVRLKYRNPYTSSGETRELLVPVYQDGPQAKAWFEDWNEPVLPAEGGSFMAILRYNGCLFNVTCADPDVKLDIRMQTFWDVSIDPYVKVEVTATVPANPSSEKRSFILDVTDRKGQTVLGRYPFYQAGSSK